MNSNKHTLSLYCKSYINDLHRAIKLCQSVELYNSDQIPFYMSVPSSDISEFKKVLPKFVNLIEDEQIDSLNEGWKGQQIVKSQFWKLGYCHNYVCIDSDCYFIRPFTTGDFMFDDQTPYTVCHEYKHFFEFLEKHPVGFDPYESFVKERLSIMNLFGRSGTIYDFGPGPTIWSEKVWRSLEEKYLQPNNLTFANLIEANSSEFTWYGEWLLYDQTIRLVPRGPLFKNYHYPIQFQYDQHYNYGEEQLKKYYLGVGLQSIYTFD